MDAARIVAARIAAAVSQPWGEAEAEGEMSVSASVGVAVSEPGDVGDGDALVRAADVAMYAAKRAGRGGPA